MEEGVCGLSVRAQALYEKYLEIDKNVSLASMDLEKVYFDQIF